MRRGAAGTMLAILMVFPAAGLAHGTFVDSRPLPGVTVGGTVDEVAFLFPEPVIASGAVISLIGPDGLAISTTGPAEGPADPVVRQPIRALVEPGRYRVIHSVPSADGFVFEGTFDFTYQPTADPLSPLPYGRNTPLGWVTLGGILVVTVAAVVLRSRRFRAGWTE
ncbi:MAG TPA: copper resistance protein CopC [Acidimicrobiia bacterium]|nr:copper resistance protein CopC [Acidimicrobiia bacterium]